VRDAEGEASFLHMLQDFPWHLEGRRADEREVGAEFRERVGEGMDRPSILEVADQGDVLSLESSLLVPDRVEVQEGLRRMLPCAVARVDDRLIRELGREPRGSLLRMTQHDDVAVGLDHPDRIGEGLALLDGGPLGSAEPEDAPAQAGHRTLERKAGPRGRLEEQRGENLSIQGPRTPRADRDRHHLLRGLQDQLNVRLRELADREDVPPLEVRHQAPYSEVQLKECPPRRGRTYRAASAIPPTSRVRILPPQL